MVFGTGFFEIWFALIFFLIWASMYEILMVDFNYAPESACRIVTAIHGLTVTMLSAFAWHLGPDPFKEIIGENTFSQKLALTISLGYFIFDMAWCLYYQTEGYTMIAHHAISLTVISRVLIKGIGGSDAVVGLFCMEITNPFLQARWFVRTAGYKDTTYYTMIEATFILMFIFFRLGMGSALCYHIVKSPYHDLENKISAVALYCISWVFMVFIARYFIIKYVFRSNIPRTGSVLPTKTSRGDRNDRLSISTPETSLFRPGTSGASDMPPARPASLPVSSSRKEKAQ